jgi:hypothetical protein
MINFGFFIYERSRLTHSFTPHLSFDKEKEKVEQHKEVYDDDEEWTIIATQW